MPLFQLEQCFLAKCAKIVLGPPTRIVEYETAGFSIKFFLFEKLGYPHGFYGSAGCMCDQELKALLLKRCNAKLMRNVHQTFNVIPGNSTFQAKSDK